MGAPSGNEFWKLRSKHGRDKLFATPDLLWEAACEYFKWCDDNPWYRNEAVKSGMMAGEIVSIPTARPYTLTALCLYLGVGAQYFRDFKKGLKVDENEIDKDFSLLVIRIEEIIYSQKFEGAAVGVFNSSIIARDLGLADKSETKTEHSGEIKTGFASEKQEKEFNEFLKNKYKFK